MKPWYLGNTTVRSPFRLRDGLIALANSPLEGNLVGQAQHAAFGQLLGKHGVVGLRGDETNSLGRKWRSAMKQLGFLYPEVRKNAGCTQSSIGVPDTITPNGRRLIAAETVPSMQECFLRSLGAYIIPSVLEPKFDVQAFSPLRHTLRVMLELDRQGNGNHLNFIEMAIIVQLSSSDDDLSSLVATIIDLRHQRSIADSKRRFDSAKYEEVGTRHKYEPGTFRDYADTNFRYLKATGLVQSSGRGISLVPAKRLLIEKLVADAYQPESPQAYLTDLCNGAKLPTDDHDSALAVLDDLVRQAKLRGLELDITRRPTTTTADIDSVRLDVEQALLIENEKEWAAQQAAAWEEISCYMDMLIHRRSKHTLANGDEIRVPSSEAAAYLEWILWRAFLAINQLKNPAHEARRFKVDQDFLPIGTAPGGGPDLIFEFSDFILVVEVTLTSNSRQEAAEGEPVRRHVAQIQQASDKPVYGLFVANNIDSNTAETFRIGCWYTAEDERLKLLIVPFTLKSFKELFDALFQSGQAHYRAIRELLESCDSLRDGHEAPEWKARITEVVRESAALCLSRGSSAEHPSQP